MSGTAGWPSKQRGQAAPRGRHRAAGRLRQRRPAGRLASGAPGLAEAAHPASCWRQRRSHAPPGSAS